MNSKKLNQASKFLSFVLRHKPEAIGLQLDSNGWANISALIEQANQSSSNPKLSLDLILEITKTNDKKRFAISEDGLSIRANQGHSLDIDLQLKPSTPPDVLYHGTATRFLASILKQGLKPGQRQHVHLSADINTALQVGRRYGTPVILQIDIPALLDEGHLFYVSENGVWLTTSIPAKWIQQMNQSQQ